MRILLVGIAFLCAPTACKLVDERAGLVEQLEVDLQVLEEEALYTKVLHGFTLQDILDARAQVIPHCSAGNFQSGECWAQQMRFEAAVADAANEDRPARAAMCRLAWQVTGTTVQVLYQSNLIGEDVEVDTENPDSLEYVYGVMALFHNSQLKPGVAGAVRWCDKIDGARDDAECDTFLQDALHCSSALDALDQDGRPLYNVRMWGTIAFGTLSALTSSLTALWCTLLTFARLMSDDGSLDGPRAEEWMQCSGMLSEQPEDQLPFTSAHRAAMASAAQMATTAEQGHTWELSPWMEDLPSFTSMPQLAERGDHLAAVAGFRGWRKKKLDLFQFDTWAPQAVQNQEDYRCEQVTAAVFHEVEGVAECQAASFTLPGGPFYDMVEVQQIARRAAPQHVAGVGSQKFCVQGRCRAVPRLQAGEGLLANQITAEGLVQLAACMRLANGEMRCRENFVQPAHTEDVDLVEHPLSWLLGATKWQVKYDNGEPSDGGKYSTAAEHQGWMVGAGPSGTTFRFMMMAYLLGWSQQERKDLRTAVIGYLVPLQHSLVEVLLGSGTGRVGLDEGVVPGFEAV